MDAIGQFCDAISGAGLPVPERIEADGVLHRFSTNGRASDDSGWYVLHDGRIPAGAFGCWRSGLNQTWRADIGRKLDADEEREHRRRLAEIRRQRDQERARRQEDAAKRASELWESAALAADHEYLRRKGVQAHGLRVGSDGRLLVPMRDADGRLVNVQRIGGDGEKRFLLGGRVTGTYHAIGAPKGIVYVAEGYATAASVHEATGQSVACAFNATNLTAVARALRAKFPEARIIIAGDNDKSGTGQKAAKEAAQAVNGEVALPADTGDWNDVHAARGIEAVREGLGRAQGYGLQLVSAADLRPEPIAWLWDGWLARGKLHIIAGAPGCGKTTIGMAFAATVTSGGRWPDGTRAEVGNVVIWSGEDDPSDTLLPRLLAMGADPRRVNFVGDVTTDEGRRPFDPAHDMADLFSAVRRVGNVSLLIVDPIVNAVAGDSHKNTETRRALQPLVEIGAALDAAVLGISHYTKGTQGRDPIERVTGSIAFGALPRIIMGAAKSTTDDGGTERLLVRAKSNIGPDGGGYAYALEQQELADYPGVGASCVLWGAELEGAARALLDTAEGADDDERTERDDAIEWLLDELANGPVPTEDLRKAAKAAGISWRTLERAKSQAGVKAKKQGFSGKWVWARKDASELRRPPRPPHTGSGGLRASEGNSGSISDCSDDVFPKSAKTATGIFDEGAWRSSETGSERAEEWL